MAEDARPFDPHEAFDWPAPRVPVSAVVGRGEDEAADMYRFEGFMVEIVRIEISEEVTHDLRLNRIRLFTRDGLVVKAEQG